MNAKDVICRVLDGGFGLMKGYVQDMSDADLLVRTAPGANHLAWQLGHVIVGTRKMVASLGHSVPELPAGFEAAHGREGGATTSDDPARFASRAQYVQLLDQMHACAVAAVAATPDQALDDPAPEYLRARFPTVGAVLTLVGTHVLMHVGQFVPVRRKLGKPVLF